MGHRRAMIHQPTRLKLKKPAARVNGKIRDI
jgi:hypothetical protein